MTQQFYSYVYTQVKTYIHTKNLYIDIHSSIIHKSQKAETA